MNTLKKNKLNYFFAFIIAIATLYTYNENNKECHIIEIQYGSKTDEDDIERISFYENNEK